MTTKRSFPVFLVLGVLVLAACTPAQPTPTDVPTAAPATEAPAAPEPAQPLVEEFLAALNAGDAETAVSFLAEDALFTLQMKYERHLQPEPIEGKEAIVAFLEGESWGSNTIEPRNFAEENGVVIFGCKIFSGSTLIASGSGTTSNGCVVIVRDGLIVFVGDQPQQLLYFTE
jgi:ketosteroid isomerase-like protein